MKKNKLDYYTNLKYLLYLDILRESGATNMHGATSYLMKQFSSLTQKKADEILTYWMKTFEERYTKNKNKE